MVSVFLIDGSPLESIPNPTTVDVSIEGVTSEASRSEKGDITVINKVNSIGKLKLNWSYLTVAEMEALCVLLKIDVVNVDEVYEAKDIEDVVFSVTTRLLCGIRTITCYVGDTITGTLFDVSGDEDSSEVGGEYWTNVSISLIGTGEEWQL